MPGAPRGAPGGRHPPRREAVEPVRGARERASGWATSASPSRAPTGRPREISGTLKFMAPEQLRGEPADRTTDAYGAGATAFDLRYGRAAVRATCSRRSTTRSRRRFPLPRSPAEAYFQHVLRGMLAKRKDDRPQDLCEPRPTSRRSTPRCARGASTTRSSSLGQEPRPVPRLRDRRCAPATSPTRRPTASSRARTTR